MDPQPSRQLLVRRPLEGHGVDSSNLEGFSTETELRSRAMRIGGDEDDGPEGPSPEAGKVVAQDRCVCAGVDVPDVRAIGRFEAGQAFGGEVASRDLLLGCPAAEIVGRCQKNVTICVSGRDVVEDGSVDEGRFRDRHGRTSARGESVGDDDDRSVGLAHGERIVSTLREEIQPAWPSSVRTRQKP